MNSNSHAKNNSASYLSANDPAVHLGLGSDAMVERHLVEWPDGAKQEVREVSLQRTLTVRQAR